LGVLTDLEVTERGSSSGRVVKMSANGRTLTVTRPEQYRTLFNLPSTRFEVEATAKVTVLGAGGQKTELPSGSGTQRIAAVGAGGVVKTLSDEAYLIADGSGTA